MIAVDRSGQQLLNTRREFGAQLGKTSNMPALELALTSGRIEASDVFKGTTSGEWVYNVTMPLDAGKVAALIATQNAKDLGQLVTTEGLASGWSAAVIDQGGHVVASSGVASMAPGTPFDARILSSLTASSGVFEDKNILPDQLLGYAQIFGWSWKTVVWGPVSTAQASILTTWRFLIIGGIALLVVAVLAAYAVARQVRTTIRDIADMANRMGQGDIVAPIDTGVTEANQVAVALSNASFDRSQTEDRLHFIMHELVHRTKNLLSLAQAMMRQIAKQADSVEVFQAAVSDRLDGLARSIELLTSEQWSGASLRRVIDIHLQAFPQAAEQIEISGQDFVVKPEAVQNLGLALHELATNSVKYGALSVPHGRVSFSWEKIWIEDQPEPMLRVVWEERNGPEVVAPSQSGFGTTVIKTHAAAAFRGTVEVDYLPGGLVWTSHGPARRARARVTPSAWARQDRALILTRTFGYSVIDRLDDILGHLLGVAEQHHRAVLVEQRVVDAGIAGAERALDEQAGLGLVDVEDRHAVDRRGLVVAGGRVGDVVGADDIGDVGLGEFAS